MSAVSADLAGPGEQDLLAQVRWACAAVAARARQVRIDADRVAPYAEALSGEQLTLPELDPRCHYLGHGTDTAAFFLTLEAVNFGSGYFPYLRKTHPSSGYFTIAAALADRCRRLGPLTARELSEISAEECRSLFGQDADNPPIAELMALFARSLNELGRHLLAEFAGRFDVFIEAAGGSAERLVRQLAALPGFADVAVYDGLAVPFYKRAQITAADLALAFGGGGLGRFHDLHRLTLFADNLVPHVLRLDGVLRYAPDLARRIDAGEPLAAGSPEEVELRAAAVHAVELMVDALHRAGRRHDGRPVTAHQIDNVLWNRGLEPRYRELPLHRTRTLFY